MVTMTTVLAEMAADPEAFLRHYLVYIAGGAAATSGTPSGIATFQFEDAGSTHRGFTTGLSGLRGITKNRSKIRFSKRSLPPAPNLGADQFNAWYVAMVVSGSGAPTTHTMLSGTAGPDIALTSQLSGCTFGVGSNTPTGDRLVSHIQPAASTTAARGAMHTEMVAGLNNQVGGIFERENRAGAESYGDLGNRATVIGTRHKGKWRFYAQTYSGGNGFPIFKVERVA